MTTDYDSKRRQLENLRENLQFLEERMSEYVLSTDIPLGLVKERQALEEQIANLEAELALQRVDEKPRPEHRPDRRLIPLWGWVLVLLVVLGVVAGIASFRTEFLRWYVDRQNIPRTEAYGPAKKYVGAGAFNAIPFRNISSPWQYIAVLAKSHEGETVHILEGSEGVYEEQRIYSIDAPWKDFGVIDVDGDGHKEIFSVAGTEGWGFYVFTVTVYSTLDSTTYSLTGRESTLDAVPKVSCSPNASQREDIKRWLHDKGKEYIVFGGPARDEWVKANGKGFHGDELTIREFEGEIPPREAPILCEVDDGEFEWISYFRGDVLGYDKSKDVHFVLYVPEYGHDDVPTMVSGDQYLWLGTCIEDGILAFNKDTVTFEIIPAPELAENPDRVFALDLQVRDTALFDGSTRLTLPDHIDIEDEFREAVGCALQPPLPTIPSCACIFYHTVANGERLEDISLRYGVIIWNIAQCNRIANLNYVRAGDVLCIPAAE